MHLHGALGVRHTYNRVGASCSLVVPGDVLLPDADWVGGLITGLHAVIHHGATLVTQPAFDAAAIRVLPSRFASKYVLLQ